MGGLIWFKIYLILSYKNVKVFSTVELQEMFRTLLSKYSSVSYMRACMFKPLDKIVLTIYYLFVN